jgi:hypothetical protein
LGVSSDRFIVFEVLTQLLAPETFDLAALASVFLASLIQADR